MEEWKEYLLRDIVSNIISGGTPETDVPAYYKGDIPWLNSKEINFNRITRTKKTISESGLNNSGAKWIPKNSVIVVMCGATAAKVAYSLIDLTTNQACCNLIIDKDKADSLFVYYYLQASYGQLKNRACGTAQQNLNLRVIADFPVFLPSLTKQRTFAAALFSLDEKIDLLKRQNTTLEKIAGTLFREWFIENINEETGLGSVIETLSGGTPARAEIKFYEHGTVNWVKSKELNGGFISEAEEKITVEALVKSSAKIIPPYAVLIAMYGDTIGRSAIISKEMACNQAVCALISNHNYPYTYLYAWAKSKQEELFNSALGSVQQNISLGMIRQQRVSCDNELIAKYHKFVLPYFEKMALNGKQICTLTHLRDILLVKLLKREIEIKGM